MRAAYIEQLGDPDVIRYGPLPDPEPGPGEVLVDVETTTVNRVDTFVRSGVYRTPVPFPFVLGRDLAGTVSGTGAGVERFAVGDRVWCNSLGHAGRQGAMAERAVVPADRLYPLPPGAAADDAVAAAHPVATAHLAVATHGATAPGEVVLVVGAGGNVGGAAVVLAARAGARVVAVARGGPDGDAQRCRDLGADTVVDYRDPESARRLREACPDGVDVVVDAHGTNDLTTGVDLLAPRGRIVLLAGATSTPVLPAGQLYMKDASVRGFAISSATVDELAAAAGSVNDLLADGALRPRHVERLPLARTREVHRRVEDEGLHGTRFLLHP